MDLPALTEENVKLVGLWILVVLVAIMVWHFSFRSL